MQSSTLPNGEVSVTLGVDTHKDTHVAVALDGIGRHQGALSVPATITGYRKLLGWARGFGLVEKAGVEGTGSFGAGLARFLRAEGVEVFEVIRPKRRDQYRAEGSDPIDAEVAARALLAGTATGVSKGADGEVEMMRALRTTRRSALKARTQAANQMRALLITAPEQLRAEMRESSMDKLVKKAARFRPGESPDDVATATKFALRSVARRYRQLSEEISELGEQLDRLVAETAPELVAVKGLGTDTAASLMIAALKTTPSASRARRLSPTSAALPRFRLPPARGCVIASTVGVTATLEQSPAHSRSEPYEPGRTHPELR
jgi:transposase